MLLIIFKGIIDNEGENYNFPSPTLECSPRIPSQYLDPHFYEERRENIVKGRE